MKNFYLILLLLLIASTPVFAQSEAETQFNLGRERRAQNDLDGAIRAYSECIRLAPKSTACYHNRGLAYSEKERFSEAVGDFTEAIKIKPNDPTFYNVRAIAYHKLKEYDLMIADLNASLKINPNDARVKKLLELATSIANDAATIKAGEALLGPLPELLAKGFFTRGKEEYEKKDDAAAIESLSECVRRKPDFADCYFYRGQAYDRQRKHQEALRTLPRQSNFNQKTSTITADAQ